jgi:hypothetical protein
MTALASDDFPAAHSMDTTWWAMDDEGHIARLETGENGARPRGVEGPYLNLLRILAQQDFAGLTFYVDDLMEAPDGKLLTRRWQTRWNDLSPPAGNEFTASTPAFLIWLADERALQQFQKTAPSAIRLPTGEKIVVWAEILQLQVEEMLRSGAALRACAHDYEIDIERFGFFAYDEMGYWGAYCLPLERGATPPSLVQIDALPAVVGDQFELVPIAANFRHSPLLQPFEHGPAECWGEHWTSTTGRVYLREMFDAPSAFNVICDLGAAGRTPFTALLASYIVGDSADCSIFNDYLADQSQLPIRDAVTNHARFEEALLRFLTPAELLAFEAACLEHALPSAGLSLEGNVLSTSIVEVARRVASGAGSHSELKNYERLAINAWSNDRTPSVSPLDTPVNRYAWALLALVRQWPLLAARTLRVLSLEEAEWQVTHLLRTLQSRNF